MKDIVSMSRFFNTFFLNVFMATFMIACDISTNDKKETTPQINAVVTSPTTDPSQFEGATLKGRVKFNGAAPKRAVQKMNSDAACLKLTNHQTVLTEDTIVSKDGFLANVFIYVKDGVTSPVPPPPKEPLILEQTKCNYVPHVFGIRVGQVLRILNSDPTLHNVNGQAKINDRFNHGMPRKGDMIEKKFLNPEQMIKLKCDVHGWMNAYFGVMDHPYFSVSDSNGHFDIKSLPPGKYTVNAWHEKLGTKSDSVIIVQDGKTFTVDFTF